MKTLRELRKEKNLTQKELAQMLNVTSQAIANFENGTRAPNLLFAKKYAKVFGVSLDEFVEGFEANKKTS
ncbi:MAG: helix-turn-helix transcriptional regulator [Clostridia bacterium]|nr:helix-turn-helix transcriptional regulator [Clostridia bacterium]